MPLTSFQKRYLRGLAHSLSPVVMLGQKGVTPSLVAELGLALNHHELVKVRLPRQMPAIGDARVVCEQAGRGYEVAVSVTPTPNPQFRGEDAQVFDAQAPVLRLSTIVGRY